jgi:hypothetical protein
MEAATSCRDQSVSKAFKPKNDHLLPHDPLFTGPLAERSTLDPRPSTLDPRPSTHQLAESS